MTQILDLAAVFKRNTVGRVDGGSVTLLDPQELGIVDEHRLRSLIDEVMALSNKEGKTEQDAEEASRKLHDLAALIVVDCPDDLIDWECAAIFQVWMEHAPKDQTVDPPKPRRQTGVARSRGSKRSTAATPKRGSTSRSGS